MSRRDGFDPIDRGDALRHALRQSIGEVNLVYVCVYVYIYIYIYIDMYIYIYINNNNNNNNSMLTLIVIIRIIASAKSASWKIALRMSSNSDGGRMQLIEIM